MQQIFNHPASAFCIAAGAAIFVMASYEICSALYKIVEFFLALQSERALYVDILSEIITAIDLYLVAIVLLIFVFGIYELFIDEFVDLNLQVLKITSLDELKHKLGSVIIMVLVVDFFKRILHTDFNYPFGYAFARRSYLRGLFGFVYFE